SRGSSWSLSWPSLSLVLNIQSVCIHSTNIQAACMQEEKSPRRSNRERTEATRAALLDAARKLFVEKSYAETGTPEIVAAAGVTRGALYHHFADKQALLRAVVEAESQAVADEVEKAAPVSLAPLDALRLGGTAFLAAMTTPGRTRLLLLDGPAVLGRTAMDDIESRHRSREHTSELQSRENLVC